MKAKMVSLTIYVVSILSIAYSGEILVESATQECTKSDIDGNGNDNECVAPAQNNRDGMMVVDSGLEGVGVEYENDEEDDEDDNEEDGEDGFTYEFEVPEIYTDYHEDCAAWAERGDCNSNPIVMLQECIPSCLSNPAVQNYGLLAWNIYRGTDKRCVNTWIKEGKDEPDCESWAGDGLCIAPAEKEFMLTRCRRSCMVCIAEDEKEMFEIGEGQSVPLELLQETVNVLINTAYYMQNIVMNTENELYHSVRNGACKNEDEMCAVWAAEGKCDEESGFYKWMTIHCGPVCQTCELMDFQIRCPIPEGAVDALSSGGGDNGLHALFERIAGERNLTQEQIGGGMENLDYTVEVFSRPGGSKNDSASHVIDGPWVVTLDNFLSAEECEKLIELGQSRGYENSMETSTLSNGNLEEEKVTGARTSTNAWCDDEPLESSSTSCKEDPIMKEVWNRIALVTGIPVENSENLQLLHYTPGQFYKAHNDYIAAHTYGPSGPRVLTFFLYLNDVEEGGGTNFPELAPGAAPLTVQPKRGKALIWPSVLDEDVNAEDERTRHEALIVGMGFKYAANAWLHLRDEQHLQDSHLECG